MTVARLEAEMSGIELLEWFAFFEIEHERAEEERMHAKARDGAAKAKARPRDS